MSLSANIEHLAAASGIEAVCVETPAREFRGDLAWRAVLEGSLDLFAKTDQSSVRVVVGDHTVVVQSEGPERVALVLRTGHAVAKSLRRMIRRMARKDRGPLSKSGDESTDAPVAANDPSGAARSIPLGTPTSL